MKTDRELLELAAKAAGIDAYWDEEYQRMQMDYHHKGGTNYEEWNPLTDDGDALRLAVKLNINVHKGFVYTPTGRLFDCRDYATPIGATRRAITRAAAAIGEGIISSQPASHMLEDNYEKTQAEAFYGENK